EGYLLLPAFALLYLLRGRGHLIPLFAVGLLVYSAIGGLFYYHDWLWLWHQNPYNVVSVYGHGGLFDFIGKSEDILGIPLVALLVLGWVWAGTAIARRGYREQPFFMEELLLIYGCLFIYVAAHSVFWALGVFGSAGTIRVMAGIT